MSFAMSDVLPSMAGLFPQATEEDWRKRVESVLKGADFARKLVSRTHDAIEIQPLYGRRAEAEPIAGARGARPWRIAARVDHPDPDAASALAREDLEGGADMLELCFRGGRGPRGLGLACDTVADLDAALAGVRLDLIRIRVDPGPAGRSDALLTAALVERRKLDPSLVEIDFGLDPIASLLSLGEVPWDWAVMSARLAQTVTALMERGFGGPFLTVDIRPYHEAGASEGQELAAALAQGLLYLRALAAHGIPLDRAFRAISFVAPVDADQFLGAAKLRALRLIWARLAAWCGVGPRPAFVHAETSWRMLTRRDPYANILRNTLAAFAAGTGGADGLSVLPYTLALGLPDAAARRLARNTSIVLLEEANLWRVADPVAGAGAFEALTEELAAAAWGLFQEVESEGGLLTSLALGRLQGRIAKTAKARATAVAARKEPITGTSEFAHLAETAPAVLAATPTEAERSSAMVGTMVGDGFAVDFGMDTEAAISHLLADSARAAPAGEKPAGVALQVEPLPSRRLAEPFEALRDRADAALARTGRRPQVALVTLGPLADHAARLAFARQFFEAGGIESEILPFAPATGDLPTGEHGLFCLVGSDAAYAADAPAAARALKAGNRAVWLAGRPGEMKAEVRDAGVARFVFAGCDVVEVLADAFDRLENK